MKKKGFTLAELLIVIVILGIMGAIAMPRFYKQKEKGVVAEAINMLSAIRQGELAFKLESPTSDYYTGADWGQIGIDMPATNRFSYAVSSAGLITATRIPLTGVSCASNLNLIPVSYSQCNVTLDSATGDWGGSHPFRPNAAS